MCLGLGLEVYCLGLGLGLEPCCLGLGLGLGIYCLGHNTVSSLSTRDQLNDGPADGSPALTRRLARR